MAVTVSQTGTAAHNAGAATQTFNFTTVTGDILAVFFIGMDSVSSNAISSVTWDVAGANQACTLIATRDTSVLADGGVRVYGLINPAVGAKVLTVVQTLAQPMSAGMQSYTGCESSSVANACVNVLTQSGSNTTFNTAGNTSNSGDMVVGMGLTNGATSLTLSDTTIYNITPTTRITGANRKLSTGASITLTNVSSPGASVECCVSFVIQQPILPQGRLLDWSKPFNVPSAGFDKSLALNLNLFKNPIPFGGGGGGRVAPILGFEPLDFGYNRALYSSIVVTAPFIPRDWSTPRPLKFSAPAQPYNLALYSDAMTTQLRTPRLSPAYALPPFRPDASRGLNLNLFTNPIPFNNPPTVSTPARSRAPGQVAYNQNLYTVTVVAAPFFNFVPVPPTAPRFYAPSSFNVPFNAVTVGAAPFIPVDYSKSFFPRVLPFDQKGLNLQLFTNPIPFFNVDYSVVMARSPRAPDQVAYNLNVYTVVVVAAPFVPIDYSKPFFPRVLPPDPPALNIQLFTNPIPFAQYDWSKPQATPRFLPDASVAINIALNFTVQAVPFAQYDWSKSALPNIPAPLIYQRDPTKFANPIPFAQLDWSKPMRGTLVLQPATLTQALPLRATVVVSTELHARPFIGSNMGWKPF